jgi:hypothetical protein
MFPGSDLTSPQQAFLLEDYKQKISYLTNHLQRMWTRFNFFVTLEAALLGGKVLMVGEGSTPMVGFVGVILSTVWYVMGAQDRFLSDFYRWQVKEAADRWKTANSDKSDALGHAYAAATDHVGKVEDALVDRYRAWKDQQIKSEFWRTAERIGSWRCKHFSTTHLAAWVPLLALAGWGLYAILVTLRE